MKKYFCSLMILLPIFVFCQKKDSVTDKPHKFAIGLTFSPDYGNLFLIQPSDFYGNRYPSQGNNYAGTGLCFSTGLNLRYQLSKKVSLQAGFLYSDICWRDVEDYYAPTNYYYIGIPIKMNCYLYRSKFKVYLSFGILTNYFLYTTWKWIYSNGLSETVKFKGSQALLSLINPMAMASLGFSYDISKKIFITAEPTIKSSILPIYPSSPYNYNEYLYAIGLNVGVYWRL